MNNDSGEWVVLIIWMIYCLLEGKGYSKEEKQRNKRKKKIT